ncbi:MAG: hypothetical protein D6812_04165 [Deltaproteobacteria bacterium]|nr:MAG: hypothetical protein D6812_04165 [Deltaproteobacteria bacterium]
MSIGSTPCGDARSLLPSEGRMGREEPQCSGEANMSHRNETAAFYHKGRSLERNESSSSTEAHVYASAWHGLDSSPALR